MPQGLNQSRRRLSVRAQLVQALDFAQKEPPQKNSIRMCREDGLPSRRAASANALGVPWRRVRLCPRAASGVGCEDICCEV